MHINIFVYNFLLLAMHFFCIYAFYFNGDLFYWTLTTENLGCFQSQSDSRVSIVSLCVMLIQCIKNQALSSVIKRHQASSSVIKHHQASSSVIKCHQVSSSIIKHHQELSSIFKYLQASLSIAKLVLTPPPPLTPPSPSH